MGGIACAAVRVIAEREERGHVAVGAQPYVTAIASVTAVGTAPGHVCLSAERHRAGAAVAPSYVGCGFVDEPGHAAKDRTDPARLRRC